MSDLYRISFVTDPDGRVLLADIDLVEPVAFVDVWQGNEEILPDLPTGRYAVVKVEGNDE